MTITQERLHELFEYRDGALYRKVRTTNRVHVGDRSGSKNTGGYWQTMVDGKMYRDHRLIYLMFHGEMPEYLDHIDNDRTNNRIENLRACTKSENARNRRLNTSSLSGVKGVSWCKRDRKWVVRVGNYVDRFTDLVKASAAVVRERERQHGDFARHK
jgi:hypothetical protein